MTTPSIATEPKPLVTDPEKYARTLWCQLRTLQPATAGALAAFLRDMGEDWPQREFHVASPWAVLSLTGEMLADIDMPSEIAPPCARDWEDCGACHEVKGTCRWHSGYFEADHEWFTRLLDAVKADPGARVKDVLDHRLAVEEGEDCPCSACNLPAPAPRSWWRRALIWLNTAWKATA